VAEEIVPVYDASRGVAVLRTTVCVRIRPWKRLRNCAGFEAEMGTVTAKFLTNNRWCSGIAVGTSHGEG
jgi:hypothetical protein